MSNGSEWAKCQDDAPDAPNDPRSIILRRRARFLAVALAAAQAGASACGGETERACLSYAAGSPAVAGSGGYGGRWGCLSPPLAGQGWGGVAGNDGPCLSGGSNYGGEGGATVCLIIGCLSPPLPFGGNGGAAGEGGAAGGTAGDGGSSGSGGA